MALDCLALGSRPGADGSCIMALDCLALGSRPGADVCEPKPLPC